jgi:hypothetical protein
MKPYADFTESARNVYLKWPNARKTMLMHLWLPSAWSMTFRFMSFELIWERMGDTSGSWCSLVMSCTATWVSMVSWSIFFCQVDFGSYTWKWVHIKVRILAWYIRCHLDFHIGTFSVWFINFLNEGFLKNPV